MVKLTQRAEGTYTWGLLRLRFSLFISVVGFGSCFCRKHFHDPFGLLGGLFSGRGSVAVDHGCADSVGATRRLGTGLRGRRLRLRNLGRRPGDGSGALDGTEPV